MVFEFNFIHSSFLKHKKERVVEPTDKPLHCDYWTLSMKEL